MKLFLTGFTLFTALLSAQAFAGATNADLKCQSRAGITVSGNIPGDFSEFDLSVEKAGQRARLYSVLDQNSGDTEENAKISVVEELANGVWTLKAERSDGSYGYVVMYALPKTVKHKRTRGGYRATFDAKAVFNLSEVSPEGMDAALTCSLVYEL